MSVDKFGHYSGGHHGHRRTHVLQRTHGVGLSLTPEGDYDIKGKLLRNVARPKDLKDAVNVNFAVQTFLTKDNDVFNAHDHRIINLGAPVNPNDAVRKSDCLTMQNNTINVEKRKIFNLKDPEKDDEAVTLGHVKKICLTKLDKKEVNVGGKRLTNVEPGTSLHDAVVLQQISNHISAKDGVIDAKNNRIVNLSGGLSDNEAASIIQVSTICSNAYDKLMNIIIKYQTDHHTGARSLNTEVKKLSKELVQNLDNLFAVQQERALSLSGDKFDARQLKITNIANAVDKNDVPSLGQVNEIIARNPGPKGERGPIGRTGKQGAPGDQGPPGPKGEGFLLINGSTFDVQNKNLRNVRDPIEVGDAVNKKYVDEKIKKCNDDISASKKSVKSNTDFMHKFAHDFNTLMDQRDKMVEKTQLDAVESKLDSLSTTVTHFLNNTWRDAEKDLSFIKHGIHGTGPRDSR